MIYMYREYGKLSDRSKKFVNCLMKLNNIVGEPVLFGVSRVMFKIDEIFYYYFVVVKQKPSIVNYTSFVNFVTADGNEPLKLILLDTGHSLEESMLRFITYSDVLFPASRSVIDELIPDEFLKQCEKGGGGKGKGKPKKKEEGGEGKSKSETGEGEKEKSKKGKSGEGKKQETSEKGEGERREGQKGETKEGKGEKQSKSGAGVEEGSAGSESGEGREEQSEEESEEQSEEESKSGRVQIGGEKEEGAAGESGKEEGTVIISGGGKPSVYRITSVKKGKRVEEVIPEEEVSKE